MTVTYTEQQRYQRMEAKARANQRKREDRIEELVKDLAAFTQELAELLN